MGGSLIKFPFEVNLRGEVAPHELEVAGETLDLFGLLLLEHLDCVSFNLLLQHELVAVLLVLLVAGVLQHVGPCLLVYQAALGCTYVVV